MELKQMIESAWSNRELLKDGAYVEAVKNLIEEVDKGRLRTASPVEGDGDAVHWQ